MNRRFGLALAVLAVGCTRDLTVPPANTLSFTDAFPSAAPREGLTLQAAGGAPPYTFAFSGAPASGSDATLDAATGAYLAGSLGPALDVVQVQDANGAVREARISVGPPLEAVPPSAFVAPGGKAGFAASGGKPPYTLEIVSGAGSVQGTSYLAPKSGGCAGAVSAPAEVVLRLRDATGLSTVALAVSIGRGLDLFPAAGTGAVAPYEQIAFVASGGQPPYSYSMKEAPSPSGGPGVDPGRGTYRAGPTGNVVDTVVVADANGERRCFEVAVGAGLSVSLSTQNIRPGKPVRLVATGGRPPYSFSFAPKGNRSRGAIDPVTGEYVPGLNALATDLVVTRDATSAPPVGPLALKVGPLQIATGEGSGGCAAAPVTGNGTSELFTFGVTGTSAVASYTRGGLPRVDLYAITPNYSGGEVVRDLDGDGYADLAYLDQNNGKLNVLFGGPGGTLTLGASLDAPAATHLAAARGGAARLFLSSVNYSGSPCAGGLAAIDVDPATRALSTPLCISPSTGARAIAAGDFDGDGIADVAYVKTSVNDRVFFRRSVGGYATETSVALPAPWVADALPATAVRRMVEVRADGAAYSDLVVAVMDAPASADTFRTGIAGFAGGPSGPTFRWARLFQPGGSFNLMGLAAVGLGPGNTPRLIAWNGADGTAESLDYSYTATPPALSAAQVATRDYRVGCVAGGDFDGDGIEDLLLAPRDAGPESDLLLGDGEGQYGLRPRFAQAALAAGDVDGDGLTDFVGASPNLGMEVLFSSDGELAVGPETPIAGEFLAGQAADWDGDGVPDVMARIGSGGVWFFKGLPSKDGHFAAPLAVTAVDIAGAPFALTSASLQRADFGGASTGPDLLVLARIGSRFYPAAAVFSDPTHVVVGVLPVTYGPMNTADLDGDGVEDLIVSSNGATLQATLIKSAGAPGPGWPFAGLVTLPPRAANCVGIAGAVAVPGASPPRQRAVVAFDDAIVLVGAPAGTPVIEATISVAGGFPSFLLAAVGDVTGDGIADLVVSQSSPDPWYVFAGTAAGSFEATPRLTFYPGNGGSFALVPGASGADDIVVSNGLGDAYFVLQNDGRGNFH